MNYKVTFSTVYTDGSNVVHTHEFNTKGANRKVLRAHIKQLIENLFNNNFESREVVDIKIEEIIRIEELNFNNVWNKDLYKNFLNKKINGK